MIKTWARINPKRGRNFLFFETRVKKQRHCSYTINDRRISEDANSRIYKKIGANLRKAFISLLNTMTNKIKLNNKLFLWLKKDTCADQQQKSPVPIPTS